MWQNEVSAVCELLAPAGDAESFSAALRAGADAVYLGLRDFSARRGAVNFSLENLHEYTARAHVLGAKVYVALNTLVKDGELAAFFACARGAWNAGADALILQDVFLGKLLKRAYPEMELHLSTQAGVCNVYGARLAKRFGFSRVILARETPLADIAAIAREIETEVFVQGALCTCFSGQCYLSSLVGGNSGNRGLCKQPCRKRYRVDRGAQDFSYALSPSDLCVGEDVFRLLGAGVSSLKIEGRMRSAAYVGAATAYYKDLLAGKDAARLSRDFSDLKRAFNRGGYTRGLVFGQDAGFLSTDVQGHVGERVGTVARCPKNDKFAYVRSSYRPREGDGFKLLRAEGERMREVGGAVWRTSFPAGADGFALPKTEELRPGDLVCLTSEGALAERVAARERRVPVTAEAEGAPGRPLRVTLRGAFGELSFASDFVLPPATGRPIGEGDVVACLQKTDEYPFAVTVASVRLAGECFAAKSQLNAFRRAIYARLYEQLSRPRAPLPEREVFPPAARGSSPRPQVENGGRIAVIDSDFSSEAYRGAKIDCAVFQPVDGKNEQEIQRFLQISEYYAWHKLLYFPAFMLETDLRVLEPYLPRFDGVYAEGAFALEYCRERGVPLFAGTGFNLFNAASVSALREEGVERFVLSKELTAAECGRLRAEGAFVFAGGRVRAMELGHCPFGRACSSCDRRARYTLTDEAGRRFPLLRRELASCRFVLCNCDVLVTGAAGDRVFDFSALSDEEKGVFLAGGAAASALPGRTSGAWKSGVR